MVFQYRRHASIAPLAGMDGGGGRVAAGGMGTRRLLVLLLLILAALSGWAAEAPRARRVELLDGPWRFLREDVPAASAPDFDDSAWP